MRIFRDSAGRFIVKLPAFWEYRKGDKSSLFQFVSKQNPDSCFQISFFEASEGSVPAILQSRNFLKNQYYSQIKFLKNEIESGEIVMITREALVGDHFIMAGYITTAAQKTSQSVRSEILYMDTCLHSLRVAKKSDWASHSAEARFNEFMIALLASIDLSNMAMDKGSQIELVILLANQIDALLRIALLLKKQLEEGNEEIAIGLFYQGESDKRVTENDIYKLAIERGLITEDMHVDLFKLYEIRNKVVHRYIISDLQTNDIVSLVVSYMDAKEKISSIVKKYEKEQFDAKVGIYGISNPFDPVAEEDMPGLLAQLYEKHGNSRIIKESTIK